MKFASMKGLQLSSASKTFLKELSIAQIKRFHRLMIVTGPGFPEPEPNTPRPLYLNAAFAEMAI
jgi:hypothetical protein